MEILVPDSKLHALILELNQQLCKFTYFKVEIDSKHADFYEKYVDSIGPGYHVTMTWLQTGKETLDAVVVFHFYPRIGKEDRSSNILFE
jgi:hypothetical protein